MTHANGETQVVGPEYVRPPHCPYCGTVPEDGAVVTGALVVGLVVVGAAVVGAAVVGAAVLPLQLNTAGPIDVYSMSIHEDDVKVWFTDLEQCSWKGFGRC